MHPQPARSAGVRPQRQRSGKEPRYRFHDPSDDVVYQHPEDDQRNDEESARPPIGPGLQRHAGTSAANPATEISQPHGCAGCGCQRRAVTQPSDLPRWWWSRPDRRGDDQLGGAMARRGGPSRLRSRLSRRRCCGLCRGDAGLCRGDARRGDPLRHRRCARVLIHRLGWIFAECGGNRLPQHAGIGGRGQRKRWQRRCVPPAAPPRSVGLQLWQLGAIDPEQGVRHRLAHPTMVPCSGAS
jgi:hypothetical protein